MATDNSKPASSSVVETASLYNTLAWLDMLTIYWHVLTDLQRKQYAQRMLDHEDVPKLQEMRELEGDEKVFSKHVGMTIKRYRLAAGLKQTELAARLGMSVPWLTYIEGGRRTISNFDLLRIARMLSIPLPELFIINPQG